jgi:hypothetical protein
VTNFNAPAVAEPMLGLYAEGAPAAAPVNDRRGNALVSSRDRNRVLSLTRRWFIAILEAPGGPANPAGFLQQQRRVMPFVAR